MSEKQYTPQELKEMADQLLAVDDAKQAAEADKAEGDSKKTTRSKQLDDKTIASLPAAQLIQNNEKLKELFLGKTGIFDHSRRSGGQAGQLRAVRGAGRDGSGQRADGPHLRFAGNPVY